MKDYQHYLKVNDEVEVAVGPNGIVVIGVLGSGREVGVWRREARQLRDWLTKVLVIGGLVRS